MTVHKTVYMRNICENSGVNEYSDNGDRNTLSVRVSPSLTWYVLKMSRGRINSAAYPVKRLYGPLDSRTEICPNASRMVAAKDMEACISISRCWAAVGVESDLAFDF